MNKSPKTISLFTLGAIALFLFVAGCDKPEVTMAPGSATHHTKMGSLPGAAGAASSGKSTPVSTTP